MENEASNHFGERHEDSGSSHELTVTAIPHARLEFGIRLETKKAEIAAKYQLHRYRVRALVHMMQGWLKATKGWDASDTPDESEHPEVDLVRLKTKLDAAEKRAAREGDDDLRVHARELIALYRAIESAMDLFERVTADGFRETPLGEAVWVDVKGWLAHPTVEAVRRVVKGRETLVISVAEHFSKFPAGRVRGDGAWSGEAFREDVLAPALLRHGRVRVLLDGTMGFGSSFLEEAFGGLLRDFTRVELDDRLQVEATDTSLVMEVWEYIHKTPNPAG